MVEKFLSGVCDDWHTLSVQIVFLSHIFVRCVTCFFNVCVVLGLPQRPSRTTNIQVVKSFSIVVKVALVFLARVVFFF